MTKKNRPDATEKKIPMETLPFHALFDAMPCGIQMLEAIRDAGNAIIDLRCCFINQLSLKYIGGGDPTGEAVTSFSPGIESTPAFMLMIRTIETGESTETIFRARTLGQERTFHQKHVKFYDGVVLIQEDFTERRYAEEIILELNKTMESKNRELESLNSELQTFNTIAANDYQETLRKLYTSLEFIISNDSRNMTNEGKANVRRAQGAIQKMKLLTEDIIAYSNIHLPDLNPSDIDLNEILRVTLHDMQPKIEQAGVSIQPGQLPVINGYYHMLLLLFHHLIDNAIKFRKVHGQPVIAIHAKLPAKNTPVYPGAPNHAGYFEIAVTDNGIGFDQREAMNIFNIFTRLQPKKYKGSGIGLAICKKIMDIHGGFVTATCMPGLSTTFSCFFPAKQIKAQLSDAPPRQEWL